jgi:hypothetical protein
VVFPREPAGSWLTDNVPCVVEANGGQTCHIRNPATGGGTCDDAWAIAQAEFTVWSPPNPALARSALR